MPPNNLGPEDIHIWTASFDGQAPPMTVLDAEERSRADRFVLPRPRADFIQGRTILRRILANYLACDPASLAFTVGQHGKPALADDALQFNASHSGACLLIAVRRSGRIGIDVERQRDLPSASAIARRFFASTEADQVDHLPPDRQADGFRALWTLKEAIVKACGEPLVHHLDRIEGSLDADGTARFLTWRRAEAALQTWSIFPFAPAPGYSATLATTPPAHPPMLLAWPAERLPARSLAR